MTDSILISSLSIEPSIASILIRLVTSRKRQPVGRMRVRKAKEYDWPHKGGYPGGQAPSKLASQPKPEAFSRPVKKSSQ